MLQRKDRTDVVDRIVAICALIAAGAAVFIAVYEARLTRAHHRISVWPYVSQYNSYADTTYTRNVVNRGLGPAMVKSFQVSVDGAPQSNWGEAIAQITGMPEPGRMVYSTFGNGTVLLPGHTATVLTLPPGDVARHFYVNVNRERLRTRVCYCSLYGECWIADSQANAPVAVDRCATGEEFPRQRRK